MDYHLHHEGRNLGVFPLEELQQRRESGELTGLEYVWREGMAEWQPLDTVLQNAPRRETPPPLRYARRKKQGIHWIVPVLFFGIIMLVAGGAFVSFAVKRQLKRARLVTSSRRNPDGVSLAAKAVKASTNGMTEADVRKRAGEFRKRLWLEGYKQNGNRNQPCDDEAVRMIEAWIDGNFGNPKTNAPNVAEWCDRLVATPGCDDPLVMTIAGLTATDLQEGIKRLETALSGFPNSKHKAYPRLYATISLYKMTNDANRRRSLNDEAVRLMRECFSDGSFRPEDQEEIADLFVNGPGSSFFNRNGSAVHRLPVQGGKPFEWLALVFDGEYHVNEAWRARGGGYANTVTEKGWQGFERHLGQAEESFTRAWKLRPDLPLVPSRMIYVAMGQSETGKMREWFDRALAAQIDCPEAWSNMRWALRPRWFGSLDAMLALGKSAVDTGRFDTDVPRKFFDVVSDMESELEVPTGKHIYGRPDIWPTLSRMYEGYIAEPSVREDQAGWRSSYSAVAYLAKKYDIARAQLEAVNWHPRRSSLNGWGADLTLMPSEVAARTGANGEEISTAERSYKSGRLADAIKQFQAIESVPNLDSRTARFVKSRLATLDLEQRLAKGEWVDLMPAGANDPSWAVRFGTITATDKGSVDIASGKNGHMLFSRARTGGNFEVRGEFEIVKSSNGEFQAGLVMGLPDFESWTWYAFRMKRNAGEGQVASFARGWTTQQVAVPVVLDSQRNSFEFRLEDGRATASLNGRSVLRGAALARYPIGIEPADYQVGLGAYGDMNDTIIRYHNIQIRRLSNVRAAR